VDGAGLLLDLSPDFSLDPFVWLDPFFSLEPELDPELDAASLVDPLTDVFDFLPSSRLSVR
jgi:hypothetical protein